MENKKRLTVLVTDNDPEFLKIASEKLIERGFEILLATSHQEAMLILKDMHVDAVVLDFKKSDKSLFNFIKSQEDKPTLLPLVNDHQEGTEALSPILDHPWIKI